MWTASLFEKFAIILVGHVEQQEAEIADLRERVAALGVRR
jgi:hypothetical protein